MAIRQIYSSEVVRISDLAVASDTFTDLSFEDCLVLGPAVIRFDDATEITGCILGGQPGEIFWMLPTGGGRAVGAINLTESIFRDCRFQDIGFVGTSHFLQTLADSVVENPTS